MSVDHLDIICRPLTPINSAVLNHWAILAFGTDNEPTAFGPGEGEGFVILNFCFAELDWDVAQKPVIKANYRMTSHTDIFKDWSFVEKIPHKTTVQAFKHAVDTNPLNGKEYHTVDANCQLWVLHVLASLGIQHDKIQTLKDSRLASVARLFNVKAINRMNREEL